MLGNLIRDLVRGLLGGPVGALQAPTPSAQQVEADHQEVALRQVLAQSPDNADALHALGVLAHKRGDYHRAIDLYNAALERKPGSAAWLSNCGEAYRMIGDAERAIRCCSEAVEREPGYANAQHNLGMALLAATRYEEAAGRLEVALRLNPQDPDTHVVLATCYFFRGDWVRAWEEYGWRRQLPIYRTSAPKQAKPEWKGEVQDDATVLLYAEQGFGDTIQYLRYAPLVTERCRHVVLKVPSELENLVASMCGPHIELARSDAPLPRYDVQASLVDLPPLLRMHAPEKATRVRYLAAPVERVTAWRNKLGSEIRPRIGLTWAGNQRHLAGLHRSCPLDQFAKLARVDGVIFFALQKDADMASQVREWPADALSPLIDPGPLGDFADTAALMENLDLVISIDTAVAHVAGALGKPVWTLLPFGPDWRWSLGRSDTPWYSTMRLFRQRTADDWTGVLDQVCTVLEREGAAMSQTRSTEARL